MAYFVFVPILILGAEPAAAERFSDVRIEEALRQLPPGKPVVDGKHRGQGYQVV